MALKKLYSWPKKLYQFIANLFLLVNIWNSGWVWYHLQKNLISSCLPSWLTCIIMLQKRWNVLLVACCSLLFACCLSTSARCSLLFAHCSILSAHCWILFAHCLLLSACCWLLFARCSRRNSEGFFLVKVKKNVLHIKSHCLQESGKIGTFVYWVTQIFFIFRYNVAFVRETKTFFFGYQYRKYGYQKHLPNLKPWQFFEFQETVSYHAQQITCVCYGLCALKCIEKIRKDPVIFLAPLKIMP